eukprot:6394151-Lingulodinium_polyedra.AAC.1
MVPEALVQRGSRLVLGLWGMRPHGPGADAAQPCVGVHEDDQGSAGVSVQGQHVGRLGPPLGPFLRAFSAGGGVEDQD